MPIEPMTWVVGDFETASSVDLKKAGAWRYAEDPTTEVLCFAFSHMGDEPMVWTPDMDPHHPVSVRLLELVLNPRITWIAHNAGFEKAIWRKIMVELDAWPDIPDNRWHDTMAACAMRVLPLDLDRAALVLRLPFQKDTEGSRLTRGLSKPRKDGSYDRTPETLARVASYCADDIRAESALHQRVGWLPPGERRVWLLDQLINERGVRLDLEFVKRAQEVVDRASVPLQAEFVKLTGLKVGQRDKIMGWMKEQGVHLPNMQKETLATVLGSDDEDEETNYDPGALIVDLPPDVRRALTIRSLIGSASIKKLRRMDLCVAADGHCRGLLQYHGAGPGRWSGRLLQPQNFPRGSLDRSALALAGVGVEEIVEAIKTGDPDWVEMVTGYPAIEAVVSSLRNAIIADPDKAFVVGDFSTVELRVNLALAGQEDKIAMLKAGLDPYIDMAQRIYKRILNKKDNPEERQTGKNSVLGLGFQMGAPKFRTKYAKDHPMEFCQEVVRIFREDWAPKVPSNWYELEAAARDTVWSKEPHEAKGVRYAIEDLWLTARLPSGRKLWYFDPQPIYKAMPWDETDVRRAWTYQAMKMGQWKTLEAYGGLLTENVVQALARDLMVSAMFKCEQNGMPVVLTVHDEIVTQTEAWNADPKALEQIMCEIPDWAKGMSIPVAAECWSGDRYRK